MADLIIQGLHLPKSLGGEETHIDIRVFSDGTAIMATSRPPYYKKFEAVPLPEGYGDLIEKKSAKAKFCQFCFWKHQNKDACERCAGCPIDFLTTIVPAEGGGEE